MNNQELIALYNKYLIENSVFDNITWSNIRIMDLNELKPIASKFYRDKHMFFKENSDVIEKNLGSGMFYNALEQLKLKNIKLYELSKFIIRVILINQLQDYTNGTTEETIGLANFDFKDSFDSEDFNELIVHQLTHMILFLDNINNKHVVENGGETMIEVGLKYKHGGTMFPAYICFHSYLVGVEVLSHRKHLQNTITKTNCHGDNERILNLSKFFEKAITDNLHLYTSYGRSVILDGMSRISNIKNELNYQS